MRYILIALIFATSLFALDADEIIKKVEDNFRGKDAYIKMQLDIYSLKHKRSMSIESYSIGKDKSFSKVLSPSKSKGITFLKLKNQLWQYIPKIEKIIKIPPSMMLQSWMGTDFTNDDMVKESSLADDYNYELIKINPINHTAIIELRPKADAAIVWGKITSTIDTKTFTQIEDIFYDDMGDKVRKILYYKVKKFGTHFVPTIMEVVPLDEDKKNNKTIVKIIDAKFDSGISEKYFSKKALKRYSR